MGGNGSDRNLIFGTLALQMGFVSRDALVAAMSAWMLERPKPLGQVLVEQGALSPSRREMLDRLVTERSVHQATEPDRDSPPDPMTHPEGVNGAPAAEPASPTQRPPEPEATWAYPPTGCDPADGASRFVVLRPLAHGGIGQVSVALDREVHREVALKEILPEQADRPESRARFLLEAEVTGRLEHPGVVPLYGLGQTPEGRPFYAMRFVKGQTLKQEIAHFHGRWAAPPARVKGRPAADRVIELRQLINRFIAVCNTVSYAHSRGVIHRDLKPANILLGPYGETLVVDWGLAKVVGRTEDLDASRVGAAGEATLHPSSLSGLGETVPGSAIGTPIYMSPEQAEGRLEKIGPASDVYSLGATLYCILTGRPPFPEGDFSELFLKIRTGDFPRPGLVNPRVPDALEAVCLKAMAVDPAARHPSPKALADDLEHWLADEPIPGHREPFSVRATRWARRRQTTAVAIAILLVSAVTGLTLSTALIGREQAETERQRRIADEKARSLERQLYINRVNLALREATRDVAQAEAYLDLCPPEQRGWEWRFLKRYGHLESRTLGGFAEPVNAVAFSPDGARVLTGSGKRYYAARRGDAADLALWDAATGARLRRFEGLEGNLGAAAFSPDGALVAAGTQVHEPAAGRLTVWRDGADRPVFDKAFEGLTVLALAFSRDGKRLAVGLGRYSTHEPGRLTLWDVETWEQRADLPSPPGGVNAVAFSRDGATVAAAAAGVVQLWDVDAAGRDPGSAKPRELRGHTDWVYAVAFSPDGKRLATGGWDKTVRLWDVETGRGVQSAVGDEPVLALAYHPDGARIAVVRQSSVVGLWDPAAGRLERQYRGHLGTVTSVAFSPDGKRLVTGGEDRTAKLWDLDASAPEVIPAHDGWVTSLAFSADGTRLASGSGDHTVALRDPATCQKVDSAGVAEWVNAVALAPDGRALAAALMDGRVQVWTAPPLRPAHLWEAGLNFPHCLAFAPDGRTLAFGTVPPRRSESEPSRVVLRDVETGEVVRRLDGLDGGVYGVAYSPDGRTLASVGGNPARPTGEVKLWEVATGSLLRSLDGHTGVVFAVAFTRDGRRLVTAGSDRSARVWDVATGRPLHRIAVGATPVHCLAVSVDGTRLATGDEGGAVKLFDLATGDEVVALPGSSTYTVSLAFSPDGRRLLSGAVDRVIRVWDAGPAPPPAPRPADSPVR